MGTNAPPKAGLKYCRSKPFQGSNIAGVKSAKNRITARKIGILGLSLYLYLLLIMGRNKITAKLPEDGLTTKPLTGVSTAFAVSTDDHEEFFNFAGRDIGKTAISKALGFLALFLLLSQTWRRPRVAESQKGFKLTLPHVYLRISDWLLAEGYPSGYPFRLRQQGG
ncbi:hypothetical protein [Planifilum fimeticola]